MKELAGKLGVSLSTVSKALRNSYEIGEDTKKRVLQMADELGYRASPYASHLRHQKSRTIAVIVPKRRSRCLILVI